MPLSFSLAVSLSLAVSVFVMSLFMDEDVEVGERNYPIARQRDKVKEEIRHYRGLPSTLSTVDPVTWW